MKKIYTTILMIACAMMFASCQDEFDGIFDAVIEDFQGEDGKTYVNSEKYTCWANGDKIKVFVERGNDFKFNGNGTIAANANDANHATLTFQDGLERALAINTNDDISAIYPAINTYDGEGIEKINQYKFIDYYEYETIPGTNYQKVAAPMAAHVIATNGAKMNFYNLASLIKINITNSRTEAITLKKIKLSTPTEGIKLQGKLTYTQAIDAIPVISDNAIIFANNDPQNQSNQGDYTELRFTTNPVTIAPATTQSFYMFVPAEQTCQYTVEIFDNNDQSLFNKTTPNEIKLHRNCISNMPIEIGEMIQDGDSPEHPILIHDATEFKAMENDMTKCYKLAQDITLPDNFTTLRDFTGTLDGANHTIATKAPLFNTIKNGAKIINLKINASIQIANNASIGAIANFAQEGNNLIENCKIISGSIINSTTNTVQGTVGGFIGAQYGFETGDKLTINRCINNATIKGVGELGGFVGMQQGGNLVIQNCANHGTLENLGSREGFTGGGIIGKIDRSLGTEILNSYSYAPINANCGGVIGEIRVSDVTINNVYVGCAGYTTSGKWIIANNNNNSITCTNVYSPNNVETANGVTGVTKYTVGTDPYTNATTLNIGDHSLQYYLQDNLNGHSDWSKWSLNFNQNTIPAPIVLAFE